MNDLNLSQPMYYKQLEDVIIILEDTLESIRSICEIVHNYTEDETIKSIMLLVDKIISDVLSGEYNDH